MKHHLNTLFVTTQGAYLSKYGEALQVKVEDETRLQLPLHALAGIVCFGQVTISPWLMNAAAERGIAISFLSEQGKFLARVSGFTLGNVLLRRQQYRLADTPEASVRIAQAIVAGKIANGRAVLLRAGRDHPDSPWREAIAAAARQMARCLERVGSVRDIDELRGAEGESASAYFSVFGHMVSEGREGFEFRERSRRPPRDRVNALLSFLYAMVGHDARAACEAVGLDSQVGFLHRDRSGRASLALDLMEEFRPYLADRLALSLINREQVRAKGFKVSETGGVEMSDETRKEVLGAYQRRKQARVMHPFLKEEVTVGLLPFIQARLLARYIRGDLDGYPAFVWK